jgi:hypothetical protein
MIPMTALPRILEKRNDMDENELVREFREWVRLQVRN